MERSTAREGLSVQEKRRVVLEAAEIGVSAAARQAKVTRASIYRWRAVLESGSESLPLPSRKGSFLLANRLSAETEKAVMALALEQPHLGQTRVATELRTLGFSVSPAGVRNIWVRQGLARMSDRATAAANRAAFQGAGGSPPEAGTLAAQVAQLAAAIGHMQAQLTQLISVEERRGRARRAHLEQQRVATEKVPSTPKVGGVLHRLFGDAILESVGSTSKLEDERDRRPKYEPGILTRLLARRTRSEESSDTLDA